MAASYANFPSISQNLAPGSQGPEVSALQNWLMANGFSIPAGATGYYGDQTKAAVAQWQAQSGIDTAGNPGYFGPRSISYVSSQKATTAPWNATVVGGSALSPTGTTWAPQAQPQPAPQPTVSTPQAQTSSPAPTSQSPARSTQQAGAMPPVFSVALQPGSSGAEVSQLQTWLIQNGYDIPGGATGYYGDQTKAAIAQWQQRMGIDTQGNPGYYGPISQAFARSNGAQEATQGAPTPQTTSGTSTLQGDSRAQQGGAVSSNGSPYFMGDYALVKVNGSDAVWLVDVKNKTMRPFENDQAFAAFYGRDPQSMASSINMVDNAALAPGGVLDGFVQLDSSYAIKGDGAAKPFVNDAANLSLRYGNTSYDRDNELAMATGLDGFLNTLRSGNSGIPQNQISKISSDKTTMAMYISALAYGGYTLGDIYKDIKRRELLDKGDNSMANVSPISTTKTRQEYAGTTDFAAAQNMPQLATPPNIGNIDPMTLSLPLYQVPSEAFQTLVPLLNPDSPEFKQKMDEATSLIYEAQMQALSADNEQELAAANASWERNKEYLERSLGISLSGDSTAAWNQLEQYKNNFSGRGLSGSGLMNETIDSYLKQVRLSGQQKREENVLKEEQQDFDYYTKYASPDQLKEFITNNPDKAGRWGLTSADLKQYLSLDNLKTMFPKEPVENLQAVISQYVDPNGNPYSSLYQKYASAQYNLNYDPTSGYQTWKSSQVFNKALSDEEKRYATYTTPDSPFLRFSGTQPDVGATPETKTPGVSSDLSAAAQSAIGNLINYGKSGTSTPAPVVPTAPKPQQTQPQTPKPSALPVVTASTKPKAPQIPTSALTPTTSAQITPSWGSSITLPKLSDAPAQTKPSASTPLLTGTGTNDSIFSRARKWLGF